MASSICKDSELRIVLLGKTGVGKSAVGNTILQEKAFTSQPNAESVTTECRGLRKTCGNREIVVVDTPGIYDTRVHEDTLTKELVKCIGLSSPGPHAYLLVMQIGRFTPEEKNAVEFLQQLFGQEADKHMILLFTRGDDLKSRTIEQYLKDSAGLQRVVQRCGGRYVVFNNENSQDRKQVSELIKKIDDMNVVNAGTHYTDEMYQDVEKGKSIFSKMKTRVRLYLQRLLAYLKK